MIGLLVLALQLSAAQGGGSGAASGGAASATVPRAAAPATPTARPAAATSGPSTAARRVRTVVVDAGHGGPDHGMSGPISGTPKIREKDITLAVSKKLGGYLAEKGVTVVYTRTRDTLIALGDRGRIANRANADVFVSIHVNAANPGWGNPGSARGVETYFLSEAKTEDARRVAERENASMRFEDVKPAAKDDPLAFILSDMAQNAFLRESSELADIVQRRLAGAHPGPNRGVKQAAFQVLVYAHMPAILVELGFGTNAAEARFLADPAAQSKMAASIGDAVLEYLTRYERRSGGSGR
jgi:N-acetylmuramoyl-L-alanine amidase